MIKNVRTMVQVSMMAALMAVCAWIALPLPPIYVTLQTFAVFLALGLLGGKRGTASILLYLLLGVLGLPVFTGFRSGAAALLDVTGGFLWGFLAAGLIYWLLEGLGKVPAMAAGMLACYGCGCWWFTVYTGNRGFLAAVMTCVAPYWLTDLLKLSLAHTLSRRIGRYLK